MPTGGCAVEFPAARNLGAACTLLLMVVIFGAAIGFMVMKKAPIFFPIIFSLFEVFMIYGALRMLFHASRVEADARVLRWQSKWLFFSRQREWNVSEILDIDVRRGMQSGNISYYDLHLKLRAGGDKEIGSSVPDAEHAAWLAAVIREAMGLKGDDSGDGLS